MADCGCFLVDTFSPTYYVNHMFFDFRNLTEYADIPEVIENATSSSSAPPTSDFFDSDDWNDVWSIQGWNNKKDDGSLTKNAKLLMVNSPNNIYIQESQDEATSSDTFMTMRTKRLPKFQSAAEFESTSSDYHFVSLRMLARTIGSPGACTAMFTYKDSDTLADVQEADIEILTRGLRDRIQYTNQPSYSISGETFQQATSNASMPDSLQWTDWVIHRLDWTPDRSIWYVNDVETANIEFQTPRDPCGINFNAWSDGGSWSGTMPVYDEAYLQIQWIEMVYNTTEDTARRDSDDATGCAVVCSIDENDEVGEATMLWDSGALRGLSPLSSGTVIILVGFMHLGLWFVR